MKARNSPWAYTVHTVRPDLAASLFSLGELLNETFGDWDDPNPALKAIIEVIGGEKARKLWWAGHRVLSAQQRVQFAVYRRDVDELQSTTLVETEEEYELRREKEAELLDKLNRVLYTIKDEH